MKIAAEFKNGMCQLLLTPEDEWEKQLVGAVAKGGKTLDGLVTYKSEGHHSYGKCEAIRIQLEAGGKDD